MIVRIFILSSLFYGLAIPALIGQSSPAQSAARVKKAIEAKANTIESKVQDLRHDFHHYPELSNREFKTAEKIAQHLRSLGIEVTTNVAHTGVVGLLKGGKPGPVVGLRADMDALPVTERTTVPFASKERSTYNGLDVGVMHACGHDAHMAILLGVAEVLSGLREEIPGTIKFIFQPAEEGAPAGEEGGAELMVKEGVLKNPDVAAIFGLHIISIFEEGTIFYKPGGALASSNSYKITVSGKQTHGSTPWTGVDPIVTAAQIVNNLQTIVSRSMPLTEEAAVVTVGSIHGGVRNNIIPEVVVMEGTIRALNNQMREQIFSRMEQIVSNTAASNGAEAELVINPGYIVTENDAALTEQMLPTLIEVAGTKNVKRHKAFTWAEDFSFFQREIPGVFIILGGMPKGQDPATAPQHHTPDFFISDDSMLLGVKALSRMAYDYLTTATTN